jgi:protein-disulfide isomerase
MGGIVVILQLSVIVLVLTCLGSWAQSSPTNLSQKIERLVRATYKLPPSVKITVQFAQPSEFANYDNVTVTVDGDGKLPHEFLVSKDNKTLVEWIKLDLTQDPYAEVMKKINLSGRPVRGNKDAKVAVVSFDDFQCPFCSSLHGTLFPELLKEYGDQVKFVYKDYPLIEIHPWAMHAAVDANCLAAQNGDAYWDFADYVHANQSDVNSQKARDAQFADLDRIAALQAQKHSLDQGKLHSCVKEQKEDAIMASRSEAAKVGVSATPTVFINGQEIDGAYSIADIRAALDMALALAGTSPTSRASVSPQRDSAGK